MLRPIREAAGLGSPPSPHYTNDSEYINSVMHGKTEYKASQWDQFNSSMQDLVHQSYQLLELAVLKKGVARFRSMYKHLIVDQLKWVKMTPKQRELHLHKVSTTKVSGSTDDETSSFNCSTDYSPIPISPDEADLPNIPFTTVQGIWNKAKEILQIQGAVVNGPRFSKSVDRTIVVASKSSTRPRIVTIKPGGTVCCENGCPNWNALWICSHTVAAACFCSELELFLSKYRKKKMLP